MALTTADADRLLARWRFTVTQIETLDAQFAQNGPMPAFSVDGVAVDWPGYRESLITQKDQYWDEYLTALKLSDGPVIVRTEGR